MIQVQTFLLPDQQPQANEFLKMHKPVGQGLAQSRIDPTYFNQFFIVGVVLSAGRARFPTSITTENDSADVRVLFG